MNAPAALPTLDNLRYGVIVADPPWSYRNAGVRGAAANHYTTMSDVEIRNLRVSSLASADCVLLLWATWPRLTAAIDAINAWGFNYVTGFPWVKVTSVSDDLFGEGVRVDAHYGVGHWVRGASEALLIARRGAVSPTTGNMIGLLSPSLYHSRKPDSVYAIAEAYPGPYLELFARRRRAGWDSWGREVDGDVELSSEPEAARHAAR